MLTALVGCVDATFDVTASPNDESLYVLLYPYYAEFCAVSQIRKKPGFGIDTSGGPGGHAVFYLNGVCRERAAGYPTIALCADGTPAADGGVGLSVNAHFQNANWVATDGRRFFFYGNLVPGERLTRAAYAETQATAERKNIYDGVIFHREVFDAMPPGMDRRDFMYETSVATDYAIAFGRDRYCARVPVTRAQMSKIVDYLNGVNAIYRDGKKEFVWNVIENNCAHLAINALAAAGLLNDWETGRFVAFAALDFPVPKNEFVNLMRRTNDMDISDIRGLYDDKLARRSLLEDGSLPTKPGALALAEPVWQNNGIYGTQLDLIFYDVPGLGSYQRNFDAIFSAPRYTDIRANLSYFAALYRRIKAARRPIEPEAGSVDASASGSFAAFSARYYEYVDRESALVDARLSALETNPTLGGERR
jgi:hypothetical protein